MVQTKISLKAKSTAPIKGVVIKEHSPNSGRPIVDEVASNDKEKAVEPLPKVKPTLNQALSSSKTTKLGTSLGEKRPSLDSKSSPAKKLQTRVSFGPPIVELF
ncbi:hypothetical protein Fot_44628 [Forsythia ovata]|uniref:Uncharacterized protein n=1 Tax=Forsythia ovata TaxID=205694 RepID=A0ABD1R418_9LAMI